MAFGFVGIAGAEVEHVAVHRGRNGAEKADQRTLASEKPSWLRWLGTSRRNQGEHLVPR